MVVCSRETPARAVRGAHAAFGRTEREHDMTKNAVRIALFGGALAAPGITAPEAHADTTFTPYAGAGNTVTVIAYAYDYDEGDDLFGGGYATTTFADYVVTAPYATIRGAVTPTQMVATIDATDWPSSLPDSYALAGASITLDPFATDTEILAAWGGDASGVAFLGNNSVVITENLGPGMDVEVFDTSDTGLTAGTASFTLEAGKLYTIRIRAQYDLSTADSTTFSRFTTVTIVPAPLSVAPLALSGLLAARRRRSAS